MTMLVASIIDADALWKIVLASAIGGIGVVVAFGVLLLGLQIAGRSRSTGGKILPYVLSVLCGALCLAAVGVGVWAMAQKPSTSTKKPAAKTTAVVVRTRV